MRRLLGGSYEIVGIGNRNMISMIGRRTGSSSRSFGGILLVNKTYFTEDVKTLVKNAGMLVQPPQ